MGSFCLVAFSLALCFGLAAGIPSGTYGTYQNVLPDCAPEINEIIQYKTVTHTRQITEIHQVAEVITSIVFSTSVLTQTSNVLETVITTVQIISDIQEIQTNFRTATAHTLVPTTVISISTRTHFSIQYATDTSILIRPVTEAAEAIVPVYVTQTAYGVNPVTMTRTDTITEDRAIDVSVSFTEQTTIPVVITETQTLQVPAITSTLINYVTQTIQVTETVPVEKTVTHREIHTGTLTELVPAGTQLQTVYVTECPIGGSAVLAVPVPAEQALYDLPNL